RRQQRQRGVSDGADPSAPRLAEPGGRLGALARAATAGARQPLAEPPLGPSPLPVRAAADSVPRGLTVDRRSDRSQSAEHPDETSQAAQKGPSLRRGPTAAREACLSSRFEHAAEGANNAGGSSEDAC